MNSNTVKVYVFVTLGAVKHVPTLPTRASHFKAGRGDAHTKVCNNSAILRQPKLPVSITRYLLKVAVNGGFSIQMWDKTELLKYGFSEMEQSITDTLWNDNLEEVGNNSSYLIQ